SIPVVPSTLQDTDNMLALPLPPDIEPLSPDGSTAFSYKGGDANGQASFFSPAKGITDDRHDGSDMIPHSFKTQIPNQGGGNTGSTEQLEPQLRTEADGSRVLLQAEGVVSTEVIAELSTIPKDELEAIQRYVDQQRNVTCRPGLLVWLARRGMGQGLLRGRQVCRTRSAAGQQGLSSLSGNAMTGSATLPDDPALIQLWRDVLASYRASETTEDFMTWLDSTSLVELVDGTAVIATPNVFVRDVVAERYQADLQSTLVATLGELVTVQLIIR
ncbi:MAG: hypothetical protein M3380_19355, partial [Chloroflexota bacterium]|nr:hypothetical protein [Chloroflexota bacterium]